jgi:DNA-binding CsgD family transcriptional regulator
MAVYEMRTLARDFVPYLLPGGEACGCGHILMPDNIINSMSRLTCRQREVLVLLATSMSNRDIARQLEITERTVKAHINQILERLELNTRIEAAVAAVLYHNHICLEWWRPVGLRAEEVIPQQRRAG